MPTSPSHTGDVSAGITENAEGLAIIKEEQTSPPVSMKFIASKPKIGAPSQERLCKCASRKTKCASPQTDETANVETLVKEKENSLRTEYDKLLEKKITLARERFNFILQSEQVRACYMLREAHRERQEKIKALESQLECKNLAALMFVMCTERTRSKLEKLRLIEEYTTYINRLQDLLTEGQGLILNLSRGYKTAARVDYEWREKMKKVVGQFMKFIYHFTGGPEETNQYFIDLPKLLKTEAPIVDDPNEDPCDSEELEEEEESVPENEDAKPWWNSLEDDCRPFVMFGDMADFKPPERRKVLNTVKAIKAAKSAPPIWKKYVFNEMMLKRSCENVDDIKDMYPNLKRLSMVSQHTQDSNIDKNAGISKISVASRRQTTASLECRGTNHANGNDMGSLLKIITSASMRPKKTTDKSALLGARDSMEIQSSTKLKHLNNKSEIKGQPQTNVKLEIGKKCSIGDLEELHQLEETSSELIPAEGQDKKETESVQSLERSLPPGLGSVHHDSLEVIPSHKPDDKFKDHTINYERYCPVERCKLMQVDSFTRSLPPYMKASPYIQFQQLYEDYETCSPEQLEILKERLAAKNAENVDEEESESSVKEWEEGGVGTQTSLESMLPPCTCTEGNPSPVDSKFVFDVRDLIPVKQVIDFVRKECLFDDTIDFDRFKVVGENSDHSILREPKPVIDSNRARVQSLTRILRQHPSLLDIFQANTRC
ncbi:unnamed protein product [Arctia plantaginis]|uniref:Uncharacterized protein n=1 Tax=Arctia plantaginis TaxID=874455 RepID=A0A8S1BHT4_ARCPL|nr:unnamed protein product [Arctia plantaginis]